MTNEALVLRGGRDGVATLTLNRPDTLNALSSGLMTALQTALDAIAGDPSVRVVVLAGAGEAFCAGHDLTEMKAMTSREEIRGFFGQCSRMMLTINSLPQPVIAKVHGVAAAAGCQLVAQCDLAVAADGARFGTTGVKLGLFCSTPMVPVSRVMPKKHALELLYTGDLIDAETAARHGLVNRAVAPDALEAEVRDLASRIAARAPSAIALGKGLYHRQIGEDLETAYEIAGDVITRNMMMPDAQAGARAFLDKAPMPEWRPRDTKDGA